MIYDAAIKYAEERGYKLHHQIGESYASPYVSVYQGIIAVKLSDEHIVIKSELKSRKI